MADYTTTLPRLNVAVALERAGYNITDLIQGARIKAVLKGDLAFDASQTVAGFIYDREIKATYGGVPDAKDGDEKDDIRDEEDDADEGEDTPVTEPYVVFPGLRFNVDSEDSGRQLGGATWWELQCMVTEGVGSAQRDVNLFERVKRVDLDAAILGTDLGGGTIADGGEVSLHLLLPNTEAGTPAASLADSRLTALESSQGTQDTAIGDNTTAIGGLTAGQATNTGNIGGNTSSIGGNTSSIETLNSSQAAQDAAITGLNAMSPTYPHLFDTGPAVSARIQGDFDNGRLAIGDAITTAAYWEDSAIGGCAYKIVAAATGTDDGGSYIDFTGFQLQAIFGSAIDIMQFGAVGDGASNPLTNYFASLAEAQAIYPHATALTDEYDAIAAQAAATWCGALTKLVSPRGYSFRLNRPVDCVGVRTADLQADMIVYQTDSPGLIIGPSATPTNFYARRVVYDTQRDGSTSNPCIRVTGLKVSEVNIGATDYLQVWANDNATACAYNIFKAMLARTIEITDSGTGGGWCNSNQFLGGQSTLVEITGVDYAHNHNHFTGLNLELGQITISKASDNHFERVRGEATLVCDFAATETSGNTVKLDWSHPAVPIGLHSGVTVNDPSGRNQVSQSNRDQANEINWFRVDSTSPLTESVGNLRGQTAGGIAPGFHRLTVEANWRQLYDSGMVSLGRSGPTRNDEARFTLLRFRSDAALWRPTVYLYDAGGKLLDGNVSAGISLAGGWSIDALGWYEFGTNVSDAYISVTDSDAKFIRVTVLGGPVAGSTFEYAELTAFGPSGLSPGPLAGPINPDRLRQAATPTKSLLPLNTVVWTDSGPEEVSFFLATASTQPEVSAATSVTVADATGVTAGDICAVLLTDGATHFSAVTSVASQTITIDDVLPSASESGAPVVVSRFTAAP